MGATTTTPSRAAAAAGGCASGAGSFVANAAHAFAPSVAITALPPSSLCTWSALSASWVIRGTSCATASPRIGALVSRS